MAASSPSHSECLGQALAALRGAAVPLQVLERIRWTIVDGLAVMVHAARSGTAAAFVRRMADKTGQPSASVPALGLELAAENAGAVNAYLLHAAEIDDSDLRGQLRASAAILPPVLAAAEAGDASGGDLLRGLALGYTLQGRFASAVPTPIQTRGWMASGVWGPPSAAAGAAFVLGGDERQIAVAIGLGGSASGGLFQYYYDQSEEKRLIVARCARAAVESALLALDGESAPRRIIEGKAGLYALFAGTEAPAPGHFTSDLERMEGPLFIHPKLHAASHSIIPTLDGLAAELPPGFDPGDVSGFIVRGDSGWAGVLADKVNRYAAPASLIGAMLNYSFVVAMFLVRGSVMPHQFEAAMADERVHRLAALGRFEAVPGPADLSIELLMAGGERHLVKARTPDPGKPAALELPGRMRKFLALTDMLGRERQDALLNLVQALPEARSVRRWCAEAASLLRD